MEFFIWRSGMIEKLSIISALLCTSALMSAPAATAESLRTEIEGGLIVEGSITSGLYQLYGVADQREWTIRISLSNNTGRDLELGYDTIFVESDNTAKTFMGVYHSRSRPKYKSPYRDSPRNPWAGQYSLSNFELQWADGSMTGYCEGGTHVIRNVGDNSQQTDPEKLSFGKLADGETRALEFVLSEGVWLQFEYIASMRLALPEITVTGGTQTEGLRVVAFFSKPESENQPWQFLRSEVVPLKFAYLQGMMKRPEENAIMRILAANWLMESAPTRGAEAVTEVVETLVSGNLLASCLRLLLEEDGFENPDFVAHIQSLASGEKSPIGIQDLARRLLEHIDAEAPDRAFSAQSPAPEPTRVAPRPSPTPQPTPSPTPKPAVEKTNVEHGTPLQQRYLEFLQSEDLEGIIDGDGDILFKKNGFSYYIMIDEDDPDFFRLILPGIRTVKSIEERARALNAMEDATHTTKVAKVHFVEDRIWVSVEQFLAQPEDFKPIFLRCITVLDLARTKVLQSMNSSSE